MLFAGVFSVAVLLVLTICFYIRVPSTRQQKKPAANCIRHNEEDSEF